MPPPRPFAVSCFAFVAGVCALQQLPQLPPTAATISAVAAIALLLALAWRIPAARTPLLAALFAAAGITYAGWRAQARLAPALPPSLVWQDITVEGIVDGFADHGTTRTRFNFRITSIVTPLTLAINAKARLTDYHNDAAPATIIAAGNRLRFNARLRPPTGSVNPYSFDYAAHQLANNIRLIGYVRQRDTLTLQTDNGGIRRALRKRIAASGAPQSPLIAALIIGDRSRLAQQHWRVLQRTGTAHLVSVSGVHIGFLLMLAAFAVGGLWRRSQRLTALLPAGAASLLLALPVAFAYALLAGFAVPVQRSFLMVAAAAAALFLGGSITVSGAMALAMLIVVLLDPWAVLSAGFWLSFMLTACVLSAVASRRNSPKWRQLLIVQLLLSVAAIPLTLWFFNEASLTSPLANIIAVPVVGAIALPLALAGIFLGDWCWLLAGHILDWLWLFLQWLSQLPHAAITPARPPWWLFMLALAGVGWLLLPRGVPWRSAGVLPVLAMLLWTPPAPPHGELTMTVLDVGQGTAIVLRTRQHTIVYDTGRALGGRIIASHLRARGIGRIDKLILSHDDDDHRGGAGALLQRIDANEIIASDGDTRCARGRQWRYDDVTFRVLHPPQHSTLQGNDNSCVLLIETAAGARALLTGDLSFDAEHHIAVDTDVLLVAHHGSRHSSGVNFLRAASPTAAVVSVGRNNYGHPHPQTLARLTQAGAAVYRTDTGGAILIHLADEARLTRWRDIDQRYWRAQHH